VKIEKARNLKPSYDPYVVCVFEWNEYISNGPKHDAMDVDGEDGRQKKGRKEQLLSMPIRRTDSDMGKPMSIPMKSRQSSNNSNADGHDQQQGATVTDPQWAHEAML
jgi:protein-serine/threonine kinase